MNPLLFEGAVKTLLVLIFISAAFTLARRDLFSLFTTYAYQSLFIAIMALTLFSVEKNNALLYLAVLILVSKVWVIPAILRRLQRNININRDLEFCYLKPTSSIFLSIGILIVIYLLISDLFQPLSENNFFIVGSILGISLSFMGLIIIMSRKKIITKVVGYLIMENGAVIFSMFLSELPFIIEIFVIMDLIMVTVIAAILAFGMDASLDEFHTKLHIFRAWFKGGRK